MFDIRFRLFGTQIRVSIWFWIFAALFGYLMQIPQRQGWAFLLVWIVCNLIASIVKEIGHVIVGRCFGFPGAIVLGGGGAMGDYAHAKRWQQILIYAAGPVLALAFYSTIYFSTHTIVSHLQDFGKYWEFILWALIYLAFLTLFWNLLNLLPMLPMDGGKMLQAAVGYIVGSRDFVVTAAISMVFAATLCAYAIYRQFNPDSPSLERFMLPLYPGELRHGQFARVDIGSWFLAALFGYYAITNLVGIIRRPKPPEESRRVA